MSTSLSRRVEILEPKIREARSRSRPDDDDEWLRVKAAAAGLTEADVQARFGGWPGYVHWCMCARPEGSTPAPPGDAMTNYFRMLKR